MKKQPVKVYYTTFQKACQNLVNARKGNNISSSPPQVTRRSAANSTLVGPPPLTRTAATEMACISPPSSYGNPCLDLFFHIKPPPGRYSANEGIPQYSQKYLKHLLPLAWSANPLTTLKLICNLQNRRCTNDVEGFYTAAYWLYQNHPKTLASNLAHITSFGLFSISTILEILYRTLEGEDVRTRDQKSSYLPKKKRSTSYPLYRETEKGIGGRTSSRRRREKIFAMANKALERYRLDPNYRLLHDGISDLYAHFFMSDIQNLKKNESKYVEMTTAVEWFPKMDSSYDRTTLISESVAKKVFPRESEEEEEADYAYRVRKQLRKEVLVPLRRALESSSSETGSNRWGYDPDLKREPLLCNVQTYLEEVETGKSKIKADALLPNEIIRFVVDNNNNDCDASLVAAAELQWKTMVEDVYLKQGKFKNWLAVCHMDVVLGKKELAASMGILLSQLSEEPWNGKVITFSENPQLLPIQGHDLKSKYQFMSTVDCEDWHFQVDLQKVFDLILQVAVNGKLKPEQMIKKVCVFANTGMYRWESSDYEAIHNKFKEKGYGDVVPQIVFWYMSVAESMVEAPCTQLPGMTVLSGFVNNNLVKSFLDNDGDISPHHFMEAAVSVEEYQTLVVVD